MAKAVGYFKRMAQALGPDGDVEKALEASRRQAEAEATIRALRESTETSSTSCAAADAVPVPVTAQTVLPVVVTARAVETEPDLEEALRLSLAEDEREKRRRSLEAETLAWGTKQIGTVPCPPDDEVAEACRVSLLQSIEEEQLRVLRLSCSGKPSSTGASQSSSSSSVRSVEVPAEGANSQDKDQKLVAETVCDLVEHTLKAVMDTEVIRLRVSWHRDASRDDALEAIVNSVRTGFSTRLATDGEAVAPIALRYEDDDGERCRLTAQTLEDFLDISSCTLKVFVERVPQEVRSDSADFPHSTEEARGETQVSVHVEGSGHCLSEVEARDVCKGSSGDEESSSSAAVAPPFDVEVRPVDDEACCADETCGVVLVSEEVDREEVFEAASLVDDGKAASGEEAAVLQCHDQESCDDEEAWTIVPSYTEQEVEEEADEGRS
jgi:hypothetical protein